MVAFEAAASNFGLNSAVIDNPNDRPKSHASVSPK